MKIKLFLLTPLMLVLILSAEAHKEVSDIIKLKNDNGIIKGFISEQIPGKKLTIIPSEATLKIEFSKMAGVPSSKTIKGDSITTTLDVIRLNEGKDLEGKIVEQAPGKWVRIHIDSLHALSYNFSEIELIGKELSNEEDEEGEILKAYGILDVIYLKNSQQVEGLIVEQKLGSYVKIRTRDSKFVYPAQEIEKVGKTSFDKEKDMFAQGAYLDKVETIGGSGIVGIITEQLPGKLMRIKTKDSGVLSVRWEQVVKIEKIKNEFRETEPDTTYTEPNFIGEGHLIVLKDSTVALEKQRFVEGSKNENVILFKNADGKSPVRINTEEKVKMLIKVTNNNLPAEDQICIFKIHQKKIKKRVYRYIDTEEHLFLNKKANKLAKPFYVNFVSEKFGEASFVIGFSVPDPGEYAIFVEGNKKSFLLFGVDTETSDSVKK